MNLNVRRFIPLFICTSVCLLVRALTVKISIPPFVFSKRQLAFLLLFEKYLQRDQLVPHLLMCSLALRVLEAEAEAVVFVSRFQIGGWDSY